MIAFLSARDPQSRAAAETLHTLVTNPVYGNVHFVAVDPNADETADEVRAFAESVRLPFTVARDAYNEVTGHFGVRETPSIWVLDSRSMVVYHGALEEPASKSLQVPVNLVKKALNALLAGRPVSITSTAVQGSAVRSTKASVR